MRRACVLTAMVIAAVQSSCGAPGASRGTGFGLVLEDPRFGVVDQDLYHAVVAKVLSEEVGVVGGCFRTVSLEASVPEEVVYVDCQGVSSGGGARLVHVVAAERVREKLRSSGADAALRIGARRSEIVLSGDDYRVLDEVWTKAIALAQPRDPRIIRVREVPHDYVVVAGGRSAVAQDPASSTPGAKLVALGKVLARLADSEPGGRPALLEAMRADARALAEALKGAEGRSTPCR